MVIPMKNMKIYKKFGGLCITRKMLYLYWFSLAATAFFLQAGN